MAAWWARVCLAEALGLVAAGRVGHEDGVLVLGGDVVHLRVHV
jgi:hypothetical protein